MSCPHIWKDALSGKLNEASLKEYMRSGEDINGRATARSYTPLMGAILKGHEKVVQVLLDHEARVDIRAEDDSTALWLATSTSTKHSSTIVEQLLRKRPDLNVVPRKGTGNTPLMQAIVQLKNEKIVSRLVDEGANLEITNSEKKTAKELAAAQFNSRLLYALLPAEQRASKRASVMQNFRAFISHIIWIVNTAAGEGIGIMRAVLGISGRRAIDDPLLNNLVPKELVLTREELNHPTGAGEPPAKSMEDCMTFADFEKSVLDIVETMGLNRFFPQNSDKLQRLTQGLVNFRKSNSNLNAPENLRGLATLSLYKTIILCDDSGSMCANTTANSSITRIKSQNNIIGRIADMTSILMPDDGGIYVRFLNRRVNWERMSKDELFHKLDIIDPDGGTPLGAAFKREVVDPFVASTIEAGKQLDSPYLICVVTDGAPNRGEDQIFIQELKRCLMMLEDNGYGDRVVSFVISRIGDDRSADRFITQLDDMAEFPDMVYVCRDQIDEGIGGEGLSDAALEMRLFEILTTPLLK
ncbi:hypothetical protein TWF225_002404 [Orbilia oligospora]|uniref:Uncharacterized protein n=1 Tax=Orbilia oligospora TaxID=2813651 RepID=A0A7C8NZB9_ORBOL|nr:hypothetical protein TWF751_011152 [Orbilia oligospora]KAF3162620.1 hypothetical protein TWF225_002404 [Orbilia oligospora]KAF3251935.1 hypothetical protein TWF217_007920 [Orbilia oligospora]KAF3257032.1 hypothetical protein TWF128_005170 [Orbilia oligospora]KAF3257033.1 hypothetical protein TWF128_005170 [Orbilia oligospora]